MLLWKILFCLSDYNKLQLTLRSNCFYPELFFYSFLSTFTFTRVVLFPQLATVASEREVNVVGYYGDSISHRFSSSHTTLCVAVCLSTLPYWRSLSLLVSLLCVDSETRASFLSPCARPLEHAHATLWLFIIKRPFISKPNWSSQGFWMINYFQLFLTQDKCFK